MKNLSVRWKILILTCVSALLLAAVGYSGYDATKKMSGDAQRLYDENVQTMALLNPVQANNLSMQSVVLELMISTDNAQLDKLIDAFSKLKESNTLLYTNLEQLTMSEAVNEKYEAFLAVVPDYQSALDEVVLLIENNQNVQAYSAFTQKVQPLRQETNDMLREITTLLTDEAKASSEKTLLLKNGSLILILTLLTVGIALSLLVGYLIARAVSRPLRRIQQLMQEAENGNLTVRAEYVSRDEIGQLSDSFNGMIAGLRGIVRKVDESSMTLSASSQQLTASAEQTSVASGHIAASSSHLADGFEAQAQTVAEVTRSAERLADSMDQIRGSSESITSLAGRTEQAAHAGMEDVNDVMQQIRDIDSSVGRTGSVITSLERRIEDIDQLVSAIQQVAEQTNLLALNASIEAARAGEAGRGFDVVAQEIRKLAESAAKSASQITDTVRAVQDESKKAVASMQEASGRVKHGVDGASRVSESFALIKESIADVSGRIGEISREIVSASGRSSEIGHAMQSISRVTEQGAAGLQEVSAASEEQLSTMEEVNGSSRHLARLAEDLQQELTKFAL
ncbi:methyl-accepting chemotaxis protein [Saccharibacillus kuerlensis]|uniref:Methyl-accepting chemotaxis protein n=1 Tax=Saccharibacillus kuerlensis TaxID=459527 RepID=A0ABQ2L4L2_9BACL|nr:HAMP domain-containing methyl-accepting chemotaxis protein [Saccharibacillus kuerlensis]GGO00372.1 methyl-accepting chemotaxis protein [Saccharibacillus kuerlensis]